VLSLYPLALLCAAAGIVALRNRALPRAIAALTAAALAVNGAYLGSAAVPALLLFLLWVLITSGYVLVRPPRRPTPVAQPA
jgi:hypothetical protein